ncbi:ATP-binding protein [Emticicia sp. BO119]|uniref:ATP-binding protein n=1 Tax=Emticicia sp. BO119 TaxID=2757768 RepID=UPI0015F04BFC|nr:ATP-binding protein [Emticicia sp. BO119]MBA4852407.1 response regulator [Emticicia sp. BO119]
MKYPVIIFLCLFPVFVFAQIIKPEINTQPNNITSKILLYESEDSTETIDRIKSKPFRPYTKNDIILGFTDKTYWIKFTVEAAKHSQWVLEWTNPIVEQIKFYLPTGDNKYEVRRGGSLISYEARDYSTAQPTALIALKATEAQTIYIKINSRRGFYAQLKLTQADIFTAMDKSEDRFTWFFDGMLFLKTLYITILAFFIVKNSTFRYFTLHTFLISATIWGIDETLGKLFTKDPLSVVIINALPYHLLPVSYVLVTKSILSVRKKWVDYVLHIFVVLAIGLSGLLIVDYSAWGLKAIVWNLVLCEVFIVWLFVWALIKKQKFNYLYAAPFLLSFIGYIFLQLRLLGFINFGWITSFSLLVVMIEMIVFIFFVGRIILDYEQGKSKAEKQLILKQEQTDKLEEINQLKTQFFTNISHEFRTPLTLLTAPLDNFRKKYPQESLIPAMQRNVKRLQILINQLLDLSKLDAGQIVVEVQHADLALFMRQLMANFESFAQNKRIIFSFQQSHQSFFTLFDADKTEKIVTNLVSNAIKFTPENGRVSVKINYTETFADLIIEDNGQGIEAERLDKIFDRFYQGDNTLQRNYEGTGIGLALVKEMVELLKGTISVSSEVSKGSVFRVLLPIGNVWKANRKEGAVEVKNKVEDFETDTYSYVEASEKKEGLLVLVIEDNPDLRQYMNSLLSVDYRIIEARDGEEGIKKAFELIPDLIISDLMMPRKNGFDVCRTLKSDERTSHIPIVILTAKATQTDKLEGLTIGADEYLSKPFNTDELQVRIANLIRLREKLRTRYNQMPVVIPEAVETPEDKFIEKAQRVIEKNMGDSSFDVERFCEAMAMSRTSMHRKLKALTNQSTTEFIRNYRLERAKTLLTNRAGFVSEVALQVGVENLSYFSKIFQEKFGVSPSEFV